MNDLDIDGDVFYFIDSSYAYDFNSAKRDLMEGQSRGRLFSYNQFTDELKLLLEGLHFPNGLQLGPSKDYLLINENTMSRIIKFDIKE